MDAAALRARVARVGAVTHEAKRLIELFDARIERMELEEARHRNEGRYIQAIVARAWADATMMARDEAARALRWQEEDIKAGRA